MSRIRENIDADPEVNITEAAEAAGVAASTFYRWLKTPPQRLETGAVAAVADYLHEARGHEDFVTLWRRASLRVK